MRALLCAACNRRAFRMNGVGLEHASTVAALVRADAGTARGACHGVDGAGDRRDALRAFRWLLGLAGRTFLGRPLGGDFVEFYSIGKILNTTRRPGSTIFGWPPGCSMRRFPACPIRRCWCSGRRLSSHRCSGRSHCCLTPGRMWLGWGSRRHCIWPDWRFCSDAWA